MYPSADFVSGVVCVQSCGEDGDAARGGSDDVDGVERPLWSTANED